MRFWFDTEFIEDGRTIDLISIGIVSEDGRTYYAEAAEADLSKASNWVVENVFPHLSRITTPRVKIARDIAAFCGHNPEFWAYYADYDWVVFCQLYGTMLDLPMGWPKFCLDVKQLAFLHPNCPGILVAPTNAHHALADAIWVRDYWKVLTGKTTE